MRTIHGISVSPGFAEGTAFLFVGKPDADIPRIALRDKDVPQEIARFDRAVAASIGELRALRDRMLDEIGKTEAGILDAHLALLDDPKFIARVKGRLTEELVNVEQAVADEVASMEQLLRSVESEYLRERRYDVRDIGRRLLTHLDQGASPPGNSLAKLPQNTILVAHELLPTDTLKLDRDHVTGIVTELGGEQSHTAILARALAIPLVTGVGKITKRIKPDDHLLLDGTTGTITITPSKQRRIRHRKAESDYRKRLRRHSGATGCRTRDGTEVRLYGNIGRLEEIGDITLHHLQGVGLFRSEYLYLNSAHPPRLARQAEVYTRILKQLGDRPAVVRTLDLGGDKHPLFLDNTNEENPGLGLRGLQFSLAHIPLFRTQLRALLRASRAGNLKLLFPMVVTTDDLAQAIAEVRAAARIEGIAKLPQIGAMIETPAAVLMIDAILELVDFVSIGTNDLIQFTLAADRGSLEMLPRHTPLHPALFRSIDTVNRAAQRAGKPCAVCGEAAGDPLLASLLVGLGARELSMSPVRAAEVRHTLASKPLGMLQEIAADLLTCHSLGEVEQTLDRLGIDPVGS